MSLEKFTYDNGLSLYIDHMPHTKVTAVNAFIPYGSVHEQPGEEGAAHALEHAVFLKTPDFADTQAFSVYGEMNGMYHNATTNYTHTLYETLGLSARTAVHQLSQILQHSALPGKAVANEMKAVRREAVTRLDEDDDTHQIALDNAMFGLPYGRAIIGHHDNLQFDAKTLRAIYKTRYNLGSMAILAVGAATPDEILALMDEYFSFEATSTRATPQPTVPDPTEGSVSGLVQSGANNLRLAVGYPLPPDVVQAIIANPTLYSIASEVISGYCFDMMRNEKGISYDGSVDFTDYNHPNAWALRGSVTTDPEHLATANEVFESVFGRSAKKYPKRSIKAGLGMGKLDIFSGLGSVSRRIEGYCEQLDQGVEPIDRDLAAAAIELITVSDVRAAIDELVGVAQTQPRFEHRSGKRKALGEIDRIIKPSSIT